MTAWSGEGTMQGRADTCEQEADTIADGFQYEDCESCGGDLGDHVIAPDALGHAHAWCLRGEA